MGGAKRKAVWNGRCEWQVRMEGANGLREWEECVHGRSEGGGVESDGFSPTARPRVAHGPRAAHPLYFTLLYLTLEPHTRTPPPAPPLT